MAEAHKKLEDDMLGLGNLIMVLRIIKLNGIEPEGIFHFNEAVIEESILKIA